MILGCDLALIEQLIGSSISNSANPGFFFSRTGNSGTNDWLKATNLFSNVTGWPFNLNNGKVIGIWIGSQNLNTYDVTIYEHEGDEVSLASLVTVSVTVATRNAFFTPADFGNIPITKARQIAARITAGSIKEARVVVFASGTL